MIANLPQKIIRYLEFAGFSGDKVKNIIRNINNEYFGIQDYGLNELEKSAMSNGLRAPLAALFLLGYHTYAAQIFGSFTKLHENKKRTSSFFQVMVMVILKKLIYQLKII